MDHRLGLENASEVLTCDPDKFACWLGPKNLVQTCSPDQFQPVQLGCPTIRGLMTDNKYKQRGRFDKCKLLIHVLMLFSPEA